MWKYICTIWIALLLSYSSFGSEQSKCESGDMVACRDWAITNLDKGNKEKAMELFQLVCDNKGRVACTDYASLSEQVGNNDIAHWYYRLGCERGHELGCAGEAHYLLKAKAYSNAYAKYKVACERGHKHSCSQMNTVKPRLKTDLTKKLYSKKWDCPNGGRLTPTSALMGDYMLACKAKYKGRVYLHGKGVVWDREGNKQSEAHYHNGKQHGEFKRWHPNAKLAEISHFANGKLDGEKQLWAPNGRPILKAVYRKGRKISQEVFKRK